MEKWNLTVKEEGKNVLMVDDEVKKFEGLGTKRMCIRLLLLLRFLGTAKMFMDIVPVKLETLREHCAEKNISLKHPCIPRLSGRIGTSGGDKTGTKQTRRGRTSRRRYGHNWGGWKGTQT